MSLMRSVALVNNRIVTYHAGMPPDSTATKARLLDAALAEFADHGIAGARVDRIAERAGANKRLLYVYFGNKEQLFETVVGRALGELADAVPFTPEDLPRYAAALFDHLITHPRLMRLATWKLLERPEVVPAEVDAYRSKLEALARAQRAGRLSDALDPVDLLILVLGLAGAWFAASPALRGLAAQDPAWPERLATHRAAVAAAVSALTSAAVPKAGAMAGP
jgi:AcrR family transcriptional regulator